MQEISRSVEQLESDVVDIWRTYESLSHAYLQHDDEWAEQESHRLGLLREVASAAVGDFWNRKDELVVDETIELGREYRSGSKPPFVRAPAEMAVHVPALEYQGAPSGLPPDVLSDYERGLRHLRNGARRLRHEAESARSSREQLISSLIDALDKSLQAVRQHLIAAYDIDADLFVEVVAPSSSVDQLPGGYLVVAGTHLVDAGVKIWDTSPHLFRLLCSQGSADAAETDWVAVTTPERRAGIEYQGGASVALRQAISLGGETRPAYEVLGFVSALTTETLSPSVASGLVHVLRLYAYAAATLFDSYELALQVVGSRSSLRKQVARLAGVWRFLGEPKSER